jgi:hypothetical protein
MQQNCKRLADITIPLHACTGTGEYFEQQFLSLNLYRKSDWNFTALLFLKLFIGVRCLRHYQYNHLLSITNNMYYACFSPAFNHHLAQVPKNVDFSVYFGYCAKKTFLRTNEFLHVSFRPKILTQAPAMGHFLSGITDWDDWDKYRIHCVLRFRDGSIQGIIFLMKKISDHDNYFESAVLNVEITLLTIFSPNYLMNND